jgi:hypothetical protein
MNWTPRPWLVVKDQAFHKLTVRGASADAFLRDAEISADGASTRPEPCGANHPDGLDLIPKTKPTLT